MGASNVKGKLQETRELAAMLLGQRRDKYALPLLMSRLSEETDIGVLCTISKALGELGNCQAIASLEKRLAQPRGLVVALTIVDALATLARKGCCVFVMDKKSKQFWSALV